MTMNVLGIHYDSDESFGLAPDLSLFLIVVSSAVLSNFHTIVICRIMILIGTIKELSSLFFFFFFR